MLSPYVLMTLLFGSMAVVAALDSSLASLNLLPWFNGLRWLRVHFITLGMLTEVAFGVLPLLAARRAKRPRPAMRWDIWLALNAGLITLLIGIPLVNFALIVTGGTLVFIATLLLMVHLRDLHGDNATDGGPSGRPFYLAGLAFFLLGIIVGTGLWLGWGQALRMAIPRELHIHANNWGFMALMFAGLLVDTYPGFSGRSLAWPRSIRAIFWLLVVAALLLVLGPWTGSQWFTAPGVTLFLVGTVWLLANIVRPLRGVADAWTPGLWHLLLSYVWIAAPVLAAPLLLLDLPWLPGGGVEMSAPQALIYGWGLQFGYALLPYLLTRYLLPGEQARLGGTWFTLITVNLGVGFLWASVFLVDSQALLYGAAYGLWAVSLVPIMLALWRIARTAWAQMEVRNLNGG